MRLEITQKNVDLSGIQNLKLQSNVKSDKKLFIIQTLPQTKEGSGPHNLRRFLAANSTQNYFLIARMLIFCDIRDKSDVFNILWQKETFFDKGNG